MNMYKCFLCISLYLFVFTLDPIYVTAQKNISLKDAGNFEDVFTLVEEVTLQDSTLSESLGLVATADKFIVLDKRQNKVLLFNKKGEKIGSFGRSGRGPGEFLLPRDIEIDQEGNIYIFDKTLFRINKYSPNGNYIRSFNTKHQGTNIGISQNNIYLFYSSSEPTIASYDLKNEELINRFAPVSPIHYKIKMGYHKSNLTMLSVDSKHVVVITHPLDFEIKIYDLDGNLINKFIGESNYYEEPSVPNNFNIAEDFRELSDYVSTYTQRVFLYKNLIYVIYVHMGVGGVYLEVYDLQGNRVNNKSIDMRSKNRYMVLGHDGYAYKFFTEEKNESKLSILGIKKYGINTNRK